ncbi:MAG: TonB-dependent receptor plug domain-containing protein, partial [Ferruginibacter sp.]|nr:TonB-dependent receptor plug domain-containing protein [Ferruginibacter sp.]
MKIKLALLSIILLYSFQKQTYAGEPLKGSFSGVVKDAKTNRPLVSVSVYITDTRQGCRTNERGEFSIHNISEGKHLVEVSHIGYNTIAENVNIQGATTMEFLLSESIVENNVVVVTGVTRATQLKRVPFQVESLKKQDLFESATSNIIEGLTRKPGVSSLSSGPSISKPVIRGLGYNRVLVINDGVRQEGQQWGDEHGIEIDESSVKKIEILKGPASLIYGSDAMAGVINIISNLPVPENSIQANVGSNYQTNNRLRSLNGNLAGNINGFNWNLYGDLIAASDYKNRFDGPVFNSKFNEHNYGGFAGINKSWGYSHLMFSNFNMKTGLIEGLRDDNGNFVKSGPGGLE